MGRITQPDKKSVRDWLAQRQVKSTPLPDLEQIRRELGWKLVQQTRKT